MTYETPFGVVTKPVGFHDCELVSSRDNLVDLQTRRDPSPGESKTDQLLTIQGTDVGLPKDSLLVLSCHTHPDCDMSDSCICKAPSMVSDKEVLNYILNLTQEEKHRYEMFLNMTRYGCKSLWLEVLADARYTTVRWPCDIFRILFLQH